MYLLNGLKFNIYSQRVIGGVQYPPGWFTVPANRLSIGVTEVADIPRPDPALFDSTENPDGTWNSAPRNPVVMAAELAAIVKANAAKRIIEIRLESVDALLARALGAPSEQGQANATLALLRAELASEKAKL